MGKLKLPHSLSSTGLLVQKGDKVMESVNLNTSAAFYRLQLQVLLAYADMYVGLSDKDTEGFWIASKRNF